MRSLLTFADMWRFVQPMGKDTRASSAATAEEGNSVGTLSHATAHKIREAHFVLVSALKDAASQRLLIGLPDGDPRAVWAALERHFMRMTPAATAALKGQFWQIRQANNENVRGFADRIQDAVLRLGTCGDCPSNKDINSVFMNGLQPLFSGPVVSFQTNNRDTVPHLEELVDIARGEEARLSFHRGGAPQQRGAQPGAAAFGAGTHHPQTDKGPQCYGCKKFGHVRKNCPNQSSRSAGSEETRAGACPLPGHKGHKASDCRKGAGKPANPQSSSAASTDRQLPSHVGGKPVVSMHSSVTGHRASVTGASSLPQRADQAAAPKVHKPAILDSGAGKVIVTSATPMMNSRPAPDVCITVANGQTLAAPTRGDAFVEAGTVMLHLKDALQHPEIDRTLLSVSAVLAGGKATSILFTHDRADAMAEDGSILFSAFNEDGIYLLGEAPEHHAMAQPASGSVPAEATTPQATIDLWHQRLGHRSYDGMRALMRAEAVRGLQGVQWPNSAADSNHRCRGCALGKAHRAPFSDHMDPSRNATHVLQRVVCDLAGPISVASLGGARYFMVLLDEWSEYGFVNFLEAKSDATDKLISWHRQVANMHGRSVVQFHTDGGGEFCNDKLGKFLAEKGIKHTSTVAHTPQHNGKAERLNRTLLEWANAMLAHSGAAKRFWAQAVHTAMYTRNRTLLCKKSKQTPAERWHGGSEKPSVAGMKVFGCDADVVYTVAPGAKLPKFSAKSRLCMFVGYDEDKNAYRFYEPSKGVVISSRDAVFHEQQFTVSHSVRETEADADDGSEDEADFTDWLTRTTLDTETRLVQLISAEEHNRTPTKPLADSEQEEKYPEQSSLVEPTESATEAAGTVRRGTRQRVEPMRYGMIGHNLAQARAVFAALALPVSQSAAQPARGGAPSVEPRSYAEAISQPVWQQAISTELAAHADNGTWEYVRLPPGCKAIGSKWVFKFKLKSDGSIERAKARLTAKGFAQRHGVDYNETFAPVLYYSTLRVLLAFVAAEDYELQHLDVETAFLNAHVLEDLYMQVPDGVDAPAGTVCKLRKALYGIKQAPHVWNVDVTITIESLGYVRSPHDECLFVKTSRTGRVMILPLFVDDSFPAYHTADASEFKEDKAKLMARYKIKDSGDATLVLGMRVTRDRVKRSLTLDQEVYVNKLLLDYGMDQCNSARTPELVGQSLPSDSTAQQVDVHEFGAVVGSLQYAALATRPDIAHAVNALSRGLTAPTHEHLAAATRVLRYLQGTRGLGITFGGDLDVRRFEAYSDADWGGAAGGDARSTTGWLMKIGTGPVSWCSKRQSIVALSSAESEYISATSAVQQILWLRGVLGDLGIGPRTTPLRCDNQAAKAMAESSRLHQRTKHINVRYHFIRDHVRSGEVEVQWIPTAEQQADMFTKALGPQLFLPMRQLVMGAAHAC